LKPSQFYIADASLLRFSAAALIYVAGILAQRLDHSNQALVASLRER